MTTNNSDTQPTEGKLTPEQIKNWKRAFPQFALCSDDQIQQLRDEMQKRADESVEFNKQLGVEI